MSISLLFPIVTERSAEVTTKCACPDTGVSQGREMSFHDGNALNNFSFCSAKQMVTVGLFQLQ